MTSLFVPFFTKTCAKNRKSRVSPACHHQLSLKRNCIYVVCLCYRATSLVNIGNKSLEAYLCPQIQFSIIRLSCFFVIPWAFKECFLLKKDNHQTYKNLFQRINHHKNSQATHRFKFCISLMFVNWAD